MAALTSDDLREYVMGAQRNVGKGSILLNFTHNLTARTFAEICFSLDQTVEDVKDKIYSMTGSKPEYMDLLFRGQPMDDDRTIASYYPQQHEVLNIIDTDPHSLAKNGGLDNTKLVKKFELTDEEYDKRPNTYRAWKKEQLAKDPNWKPKWADLNKNKPKGDGKESKESEKDVASPDEILESLEEISARIKVGNRCLISPGDRRGDVMFLGLVPQITNHSINQVWIGIKYDEPVGKNDGTLKGKQYFNAGKNYGAFVKPEFVKVGDYPELGLDFSDDDEEEKGKATAGGKADACCDDSTHKHTHGAKGAKDAGKENIMEEL